MTHGKAPTTDRIRIEIDRGRLGDKVDHPDPAVAPLGTDAEAAGAPPTAEERSIAASGIEGGGSRREALAMDGGGLAISWPQALAGSVIFLSAGALLVLLRLQG